MSEQEQFFVYVGWVSKAKHKAVPLCLTFSNSVTGVSTVRAEIIHDKVERIPIDFDPLGVKQFFIVGLIYQEKIDDITNENYFLPVGVFKDRYDADRHCEFVKTNWKTYFKGQEKNNKTFVGTTVYQWPEDGKEIKEQKTTKDTAVAAAFRRLQEAFTAPTYNYEIRFDNRTEQ